MFRGTNYIREYFDKHERNKIIMSFRKVIKDNVFGDFDAIACRGTSGLLVGPMLAHKFDKHLIVIRKSTENSHSSRLIECDDTVRKYIIVDDFASSGATIEAIVNDINECKNSWYMPGLFDFIYVGCYFWTHNHNPKFYGNKENIAVNDNKRYLAIARDKIFVQRTNSSYALDCFAGYEKDKE